MFDGFINARPLQSVFGRLGPFFRVMFLLVLMIYSYVEVIALKVKKTDFNKTQYIVTSLLSSLAFGSAFVFVKDIKDFFELSPLITMILYLITWIASMISIYHFGRSLSIQTKIQGDETDLNGHNEPGGMISLQTVDERYINIINIFQGLFIVGSAGAGKTDSVGIPILWHMLKQGFTGIVYSYKMFDLANVVYTAFKKNPEIAEKVNLKIINFTDMHRTNRINPIAPAYIKEESYIEEYVTCIAKNLNKEWIKKQDFFATSAMLLLRAVIVFLWNRHPEFCTIPHAFSIINRFDPEEVIELLQKDDRAMVISSSFAAGKDAKDQTAGVISSLKNLTLKLDTEKLFWVLSGDDVDLNLNHPDSPTMLVLVNNPQTEDTITPVLSLMVTVARKLMNVPDRLKSTYFLDEAPTMYLPNFQTLPATGRSNKISVNYMCQDLSQMDMMYEKDGSRAIRGSLSNTFYGNCTERETQKYIQDSFGKVDKIIENQSLGQNKSTGSHGQNANTSFNSQERYLIKDSEVNTFKIGEFAGKIIGEEEKPYFRVRFKRAKDQIGTDPEEFEVPQFSMIDEENGDLLDADQLIRENYRSIIADIDHLHEIYIESELEKARKL